MKKLLTISLLSLLLFSCKEEKPTLQTYFVDKMEDKNFVNLDVSSSILNLDKAKLSSAEKKALESFDKVNILAFKKDDKNGSSYKTELEQVKKILKDSTFNPLIKVNGVKHNASVMLVGEQNKIDELVLFGNQNEMGFTVIRVLGEDMKPENALEFFNILKKSNIDMKQLQPVLNMMDTKTKKSN